MVSVQNEQVVGRSGVHAAGRDAVVVVVGHTGSLCLLSVREGIYADALRRESSMSTRTGNYGICLGNTSTLSTATGNRSESTSEQGGKRADS